MTAGQSSYRRGVAAVVATLWTSAAWAGEARPSKYKGWDSIALSNGVVEVQIVPAIGGRVIQFKLGDFEYLWVNPLLAGQAPPPSGLGPDGGWLNYGGDKLWPAPQGWDNDQQWPGPPDAVLDGSPYVAAILAPHGPTVGVELTSQKDPRSGIQFSRVIKVSDGAARVSFDITMKNIDTKPRRWAIWQVTQLSAVSREGSGYNPNVFCYCPVNPKSSYARGYDEQFGLVNNPSFKLDRENGLVRAHYQRLVGKIGVDCAAGWLAVVDGTSGYVFVERFAYQPDKEYPDHASVEFWMNGVGQFVVGGKVVTASEDPSETPAYVESEILSALAELKAGERYTFHLDWCAARIGGNFPVLACTEVGVTGQRLVARASGGPLALSGRFGVFYPGQLGFVLLNGKGQELSRSGPKLVVSPDEPVVLADWSGGAAVPAEARSVQLVVYDPAGKALGELASAPVQR